MSLTSDYLLHGAQWSVGTHLSASQDEYIQSGASQILLLSGNNTVVVSRDKEILCAATHEETGMCSQSNVFNVHLFCPEKLAVILSAQTSLDRAKALYATILAVGDEEALIVEALATYAVDIIECYSEMVIACTNDSENDPFIRDGLPNLIHQQVLGQIGAIGLTIDLIDALLKDPPSALDQDPGSGAYYHSITDQTSNRAIVLLFRFLRQIVKANNMRAHVSLLEEHTDFLYKHLNSDFKVVDTISELITDNQQMLMETVTPEFTSHIADTLCLQHQQQLCGARFVNMFRTMCSLDGEPLIYNQSTVLIHGVAKMMESDENPFPQVKISNDGDVQVACPTRTQSGNYSTAQVDWLHISDFLPFEEKHNGAFEKYLMEKPLRACTDHEKTLRYSLLSLCTDLILIRCAQNACPDNAPFLCNGSGSSHFECRVFARAR